MKVFSAIVILSVLCKTSKAQHFCESLVQNNYKVMYYDIDREQSVLVIGDKYWRLNGIRTLTSPTNVTFAPDQPWGSTRLFNDYSLIFDGEKLSSSDGFYNPTKKTMDYIHFDVSQNSTVFERQGVSVEDPSNLLDNTTMTLYIAYHIKGLYVFVAHSPNSVNESLESTYIEAYVVPTDPSNTTVTINFNADESQYFNQMFEYYSLKGYRFIGDLNKAMIHQKKGSFVYCSQNWCKNGLKEEIKLIDCDALGFTGMTSIPTEADTASNGNNPGIGSPQVSTELGSDSETGDLRTSTYEPETQSTGEGEGTRTPDQSNVSPGSSISFGLDLWLILLIIFIIVAVVVVLIVSIVWFRSRTSQQKSENGSKADAPKSQTAPKSTADAKKESELLSVRSE